MIRTVRLLGVGLALLLGCLPLFSQGETGRISGAVTDQSGGAIAGATVTVLDVARGLSRPVMTDDAGLYAAPNLIPGIYTVRAEAKGFKVLERQNIEVGVGGDLHIDLTLQPGEQNQTVTVTGEAPVMNTTNAQTGGTLENSVVNQLPMNGGSYRVITGVLPGVVLLPGTGSDDTSTNGGATEWDNYMLDGLYDSSWYTNEATVGGKTSAGGDSTILPVDAIQEINLIENPKAEYGFMPGVTVDVGLKSGTNDMHGTAFGLGRDADLDAKNAFSASRANLQFEQFGGSLGGAIKKNKIFYFGAYEGSRASAGFVYQTSAPTTASGAGTTYSIPDAIASINATNPALLNQLSVNIAGCNLANSNIHSTTGSVVATACTANQYGSPSLFGNTGPNQNYVVTLPDTTHSDNGIGKLDYKISEHHSFNIDYFVGDSFQQVPNASSSGALSAIPTEPWWEEVSGVFTRTGRAVEIWTPNSNWLNEARGGYDFQDQPYYNSECGNSSSVGQAGGPASYLTTYGLISGASAVNGQQGCGFPEVSISGFAFKLDPASLRAGGHRDLQFADNVSYTRGTHQFKWGFDLRKQCICDESKNIYYGIGGLAFGAKGFSAYPGATSLQDFLTGAANSETIISAANSLRNLHANLLAVFFQDDWRITSKLTMNLGVREEVQTPGRDSRGQIGNFDPSVPAGMVQSNQLWPTQSGPSPHVGLAYDLSGKGTTVVRAGGSIAYVYQSMLDWSSLQADAPEYMPTGATLYNANGTSIQGPGNITTFLATTTPLTNSKTGLISGNAIPWVAGSPIFTASSFVTACGNGFAPSGAGVPAGAPAVNPAPCTLFGAYPNYRLPYVTTWNLSVQHSFTSRLTLNAAYVGAHGTGLNFEGDINQPSPGLSGSAELTRRPFYAAANNQYGDAYPWFGKAVFNFTGGNSNYDGLQLTLTERVSHGLNFTAGYTWSHALGPGSSANNTTVQNIANLGSEYGNTPIDFRQRFTLTSNYAIPGIKSPLQMLEGWSLSSNLTIMTPPPITPTDSGLTVDASGTGTGNDRWNFTGNPNDFSKLIGGAGTVPCYGIAGSIFAKAGCNSVTAGAGTVGTPSYVAGLPASCQAAAMADSTSNGGLWNVANNTSITPTSTASLSSANGYNGLAQLALVGCYAAGPGSESAIVPPAQGTFGNMQPGTLRLGASGGFKTWDLAIRKDWRFKERLTARFSAEIFNATNRTDYYLPSVALGSPTLFGLSPSTPDVGKGDPIIGLGGPREAQLSLKFIF